MIKDKNIRFAKGGAASLFLAAFLFFLPPLRAQEPHSYQSADSLILFHYPPGIRMFKSAYADNRRSLQLLRERLRAFRKDRDTLYVSGFAGGDDDATDNRRTARWRSNNLKGWLIDHLSLRERDFKTVNHSSAHPSFGEVVILGFSPLRVLAASGEKEGSTPPVKTLPGDTIRQTAVTQPDNDSPEAQPATAAPKAKPAAGSGNVRKAQETPSVTPEPAPQPVQTSTAAVKASPSEGRYLGVKTNLVAWAGTILNIAADVQVSEHFSVELPVLWCPWYVSDRHAVKTFTLQPEARYWLSKPGEGHFFGVHAHMGWFNVKWDKDRYQDTDRPLLGAGISYGYLLPFNEHWAGEFTLGAGYANMRYDTYYNIDNGARIDTRTKNYWGITRVGISVVYHFNLKK